MRLSYVVLLRKLQDSYLLNVVGDHRTLLLSRSQTGLKLQHSAAGKIGLSSMIDIFSKIDSFFKDWHLSNDILRVHLSSQIVSMLRLPILPGKIGSIPAK